ncbi:MAG: hypothetical protein K2H67_08275, partial [Treponemataceae bacterium]|nr:hypothetical protein [Treponemataceae bacterium]
SKAMANYINKNFDDKCNFVINDYLMINGAVSAYLNFGKYLIHSSDGTTFDFLHIGHNRNESYALWKEENSQNPTFYLFVSEPYVGSELELVHSEDVECMISDEKLFLYKKRTESQ